MDLQGKEDRANSIGIVFSGGGCQAISHIGAYMALSELGIKPQFVSGTSSGAAVAALVAMGFSADEMRDYGEERWGQFFDFRTLPMLKEVAKLKYNKKIQKNGLKDGKMISDFIKSAMDLKGINGFHDLPINLSVCACDTYTMDECIFTTFDEKLQNEYIRYITDAPLEIAVRASMTFPAVFTTCKYNQYELIDGGSKDNLPVKVLKDMGVGKVLAIGFDINDYEPRNGFDGLFNTIWRSLDIYSINATRKARKMADYSVLIKNSKTAIFSVEDNDLTIKEGYDSIMAHKDEILKIFGEK